MGINDKIIKYLFSANAFLFLILVVIDIYSCSEAGVLFWLAVCAASMVCFAVFHGLDKEIGGLKVCLLSIAEQKHGERGRQEVESYIAGIYSSGPLYQMMGNVERHSDVSEWIEFSKGKQG